ncbi:Por secretion system C-terminal sorting domain-containing protein [Soonwooa buanensis]|uniref:Por secretion system C-terminal sorting domain-containing protein n=1 Tax=Soonwooa buanensis TaxID=619805 RepID=A0A1T5FQW3_9FLAO|nr:YCF48-related protein [Soonwooa buanensis]SKB98555.1 Por secretion system C-terminal sorting domain-containing protein [Soonwooa buanensis]
MKSNLLSLLFLFSIVISQAQTSWNQLNPTNYFEKANSFSDNNNQLFLLTENKLLKSNDQAKTWTNLKDVINASVVKSWDTNIIVGGQQGLLILSRDNGLTWQNINLDSSENINSIFYVNNTIIVVGDKTLFKSNTNAITWEKQKLGLLPDEIIQRSWFVNNQEGYIVTNYGKLYKTVDFGKNINLKITNGALCTSIYFYDQKDGYVSFGETFYLTKNNGESWIKRTNFNPSQPAISLFSFYFLSTDLGFATSKYGIIYKTTNGGYLWNKVYDSKNWISDSYDIKHLHFNNNNAIAIGNYGQFYKSTDNGGSWTTQDFTYNSISKVKKNANLYSVVTSKELYLSTDKTNWESVNVPINDTNLFNLYDSYFINRNIGYVLLGNPVTVKIAKTTNGGQTWSINENFTTNASSIYFFDENKGIINSAYSAYTTDNGGASWEIIPNFRASKIQWFDEGVGIAISEKKLSKTTDYGKTWSTIKEGQHLYSFHFPSQRIGYYNDGLTYYKTNDYGNTWKPITTLSYTPEIVFKNPNEGILFNGSDSGLQTFNGGRTFQQIDIPKNTYYINSFDNNFLVSGSIGNLFESNGYTQAYSLITTFATDIKADAAMLNAYGSTNTENMENITFHYSDDTTAKETSAMPNNIQKYENDDLSKAVDNLLPDTTYNVMVKAKFGTEIISSNSISFKTLPLNEIDFFVKEVSSTKVQLLSSIKNNAKSKIENIKFIYGIDQENLNQTFNASNIIDSYLSEDITINLENLLPNQKYYGKIVVTQNGKEYSSVTKSFTTDALHTADVSIDNLKIYPNPAHNEVLLTSKNTIKNIHIINMLGQTVKTIENINKKEIKFNVVNLPSANYKIVIITENDKITKALIKN